MIWNHYILKRLISMVHTDEWEHMAWLRLRGLLPEEDGASVFDSGIEVGQED
jgi:hypothetical protein